MSIVSPYALGTVRGITVPGYQIAQSLSTECFKTKCRIRNTQASYKQTAVGVQKKRLLLLWTGRGVAKMSLNGKNFAG